MYEPEVPRKERKQSLLNLYTCMIDCMGIIIIII